LKAFATAFNALRSEFNKQRDGAAGRQIAPFLTLEAGIFDVLNAANCRRRLLFSLFD